MKTDTLIAILARDTEPVTRPSRITRYGALGVLGFVICGSISIATLGPIPSSMYVTPAPWLKLGYTGTIAVIVGVISDRLSQPGLRVRDASSRLAAVLCAILCAACIEIVLMLPGTRIPAILGHSAILCPWVILLLALPVHFATVCSIREHAPTRLRVSGLAAGLFAGAIAAMGYSLACTEASVAFVAVWYTAGIVLSGLVGALLGPRLLAW